MTYIFETRCANKINDTSKASVPNGFSNFYSGQIRSDLNYIVWKKELDGEVTRARKRAFVWGMAIHNFGDVFAHSSYMKINEVWTYLGHEGKYPYADVTTGDYGKRYEVAKKVVAKAVAEYDTGKSGTYEVFAPVVSESSFKLGCIQKYISQVAGTTIAAQYASVNYNSSVSSAIK